MKTAAIYSRKSKYTGKGESVDNQVAMCKDYGNNLGISQYHIYEDEGFSGSNINRPEFQRLLRDAKQKRFDTLICYRLDRVSRNIADFSALMNELQALGIGFISIREQFDTSTPMGRAMLYIASVFAQLERETIAERIRDNMLELAKTGRWLGGSTPYGFISEPVEFYDNDMKQKKMFKLSPDPEEMQTVKLIFEKYMELGSNWKVLTYLTKNNTKTRHDTVWTAARINSILKRPVYAKSSELINSYLEQQDINVLGSPDGVHGYLVYNKTTDKNTKVKVKDKSEWIAAVAQHKGIIETDIWLAVQKQITKNYKQPRMLGKSKIACLTGLLRCAHCNSLMSIVYGNKRLDGIRPHYYFCPLKRSSGMTRCDNKNANAEIEQRVIDKLIAFSTDKNSIVKEFQSYKEIAASVDDSAREIKRIKDAIAKNESAINNLVKQLSLLSADASEYVVAEIERLNKENHTLKNNLFEMENKKQDADIEQINIELFMDAILNFKDAIEAADTVVKKRNVISGVVKHILFDGLTGDIDIKLIGAE